MVGEFVLRLIGWLGATHIGKQLTPGLLRSAVIPGSSQSNQDRAELVALRRLETVENCAKMVEFLTTDLSDYVTGAGDPDRRRTRSEVTDISGAPSAHCLKHRHPQIFPFARTGNGTPPASRSMSGKGARRSRSGAHSTLQILDTISEPNLGTIQPSLDF